MQCIQYIQPTKRNQAKAGEGRNEKKRGREGGGRGGGEGDYRFLVSTISKTSSSPSLASDDGNEDMACRAVSQNDSASASVRFMPLDLCTSALACVRPRPPPLATTTHARKRMSRYLLSIIVKTEPPLDQFPKFSKLLARIEHGCCGQA